MTVIKAVIEGKAMCDRYGLNFEHDIRPCLDLDHPSSECTDRGNHGDSVNGSRTSTVPRKTEEIFGFSLPVVFDPESDADEEFQKIFAEYKYLVSLKK